jgi:hypothetical protein
MSAQISLFAAPPVRKEAPPATKQDKAEPQREALHERDTNAVLTTLRGLLYEPDPTPQDAQALDDALAPYLPHACPSQADREMVWGYVWAHGPKSPCFAQTLTAQAIGLMESLWGVAMMVDGVTGVGTVREALDIGTASLALVAQALGWAGMRVATKSHSWGRFHLGETPHACAWLSLIGQWGVQLDLDECHKVRVRIAPPKVKNSRAYRLGDWSALDVWMLLATKRA